MQRADVMKAPLGPRRDLGSRITKPKERGRTTATSLGVAPSRPRPVASGGGMAVRGTGNQTRASCP